MEIKNQTKEGDQSINTDLASFVCYIPYCEIQRKQRNKEAFAEDANYTNNPGNQ